MSASTGPEERTVVDDDGVAIAMYRWRPAGTPRAGVHIAHGLGEHALRYDRLARELNRVGYVVSADDHRGHGRTAEATGGFGRLGPRGMEGTLDSLHTATRATAAAARDVPVFLLGHSWGSMLAQRFVLRWGDELAGLVLSGTTLMAPPYLATGDLNAAFEPAATPYDWLSRDPDEVRRYVDDPSCGFPPDFPMDEMPFLMGAPTRSVPANLPILVVNGSVDPVGGATGGQALVDAYRGVGVRDVTFRCYPDARHELFNETNRDEVVADLVAWLDMRLS